MDGAIHRAAPAALARRLSRLGRRPHACARRRSWTTAGGGGNPGAGGNVAPLARVRRPTSLGEAVAPSAKPRATFPAPPPPTRPQKTHKRTPHPRDTADPL